MLRRRDSAVFTHDLRAVLEEVQRNLIREQPLPLQSLLCGQAADIREDVYHLSFCRSHLNHLPVWQRTSIHPTCLLNPEEQQRLTDYKEAWQGRRADELSHFEDLICHLGDSPSRGWLVWSAKSGKLPTLRRGSGLLWHVSANRQMLLKELYSSMGFACFTRCADAACVQPFRLYRPSVSHRHLLQALGNSQHVGNIGLIVACALACTVLQEHRTL